MNNQEKFIRALILKGIDDLYWEYDRMSNDGKDTLDTLAKTLAPSLLVGLPINEGLK